MSSKLELERELDKLPPDPYKPTADLRELHRLFHEAAKINEGVPYSCSSLAEMIALAESAKPTSLAQAYGLIDEIEDEIANSFYPEGSALILKLALWIYRDHYPPEKTNHNL